MRTRLFERLSWAIAGISVSLAGCGPTVVQPAQGTGAVISVKPLAVAGLAEATAWINGDLTPTPDPNPCPHHKEEFEKALKLTDAEACPIVRQAQAGSGKQHDSGAATPLVPVSGDGDAEIPKPIAPHCYAVGSIIIVVRYEQPKRECSRIVGIAVLPKK